MFKAFAGADEDAGAAAPPCPVTGLFVVGNGTDGVPVFTRFTLP